jgi:hypothetical protein
MMSTILSVLILGCAPAIAGSTITSSAEPISTTADSFGWFHRFALYGWAQSLDGDIGVRGSITPVNIGFSDILGSLDLALMGAVELGRDRWSVMLDVSYAEISESQPVPTGIIASSLAYKVSGSLFYCSPAGAGGVAECLLFGTDPMG